MLTFSIENEIWFDFGLLRVKSPSLGEDEDMITLVLVKYGGKNIKIKLPLENKISISPFKYTNEECH